MGNMMMFKLDGFGVHLNWYCSFEVLAVALPHVQMANTTTLLFALEAQADVLVIIQFTFLCFI